MGDAWVAVAFPACCTMQMTETTTLHYCPLLFCQTTCHLPSILSYFSRTKSKHWREHACCSSV